MGMVEPVVLYDEKIQIQVGREVVAGAAERDYLLLVFRIKVEEGTMEVRVV